MSKSLKKKNQTQLATFATVNVALLAAVALGPQRLLLLAEDISKGSWLTLGKVITVPAVTALLLGVIGWAAPREWKETLIFWRLGEKCLPSSQAFGRIAASDPRIDEQRLLDQLGSFPVEPGKQTSAWYAIYRRHIDEPAVIDAHGAYLLYREMTGLVVTGLAAVLTGGVYFHQSWKTLLVNIGLLIVEYLIVMLAARNSAEHLVANVLAIASASPGGSSAKKKVLS